MASTAVLLPTTNSEDASGVAWTTPENIRTDNATNARASVTSGQVSNILTVAGFDLSTLPDSATINGIEVLLDRQTDGGTGTTTTAPQVWIKGVGTPITGAYRGRLDADILETLGGPTNVWGLSGGNLTGSGLKSSFDIDIQTLASASGSGTGRADFDYLGVKIYYTAGGTTGQIKAYVGGAFTAKPVKVWNGSAWVTKPLKRWNGSAWITTPY